MEINLTGFSEAQRRALFDLLILAMYADGHLTTVADEQIEQLLVAMGFTEESDRQREFDAAVTRMRPFIQGWADELGLTAGQAVTQVAVRPAWTLTAEPVPERADPEAGE